MSLYIEAMVIVAYIDVMFVILSLINSKTVVKKSIGLLTMIAGGVEATCFTYFQGGACEVVA